MQNYNNGNGSAGCSDAGPRYDTDHRQHQQQRGQGAHHPVEQKHGQPPTPRKPEQLTNRENTAEGASPLSSSLTFSFKGTLSMAQRLMSAALTPEEKRVGHDDDFEGTCSPLGGAGVGGYADDAASPI